MGVGGCVTGKHILLELLAAFFKRFHWVFYQLSFLTTRRDGLCGHTAFLDILLPNSPLFRFRLSSGFGPRSHEILAVGFGGHFHERVLQPVEGDDLDVFEVFRLLH